MRPIASQSENGLQSKIWQKIRQRKQETNLGDTQYLFRRIDDLENQVATLIEIIDEEVFSKKK